MRFAVLSKLQVAGEIDNLSYNRDWLARLRLLRHAGGNGGRRPGFGGLRADGCSLVVVSASLHSHLGVKHAAGLGEHGESGHGGNGYDASIQSQIVSGQRAPPPASVPHPDPEGARTFRGASE